MQLLNMQKINLSLLTIILLANFVSSQTINCPDPINFPIKASGTEVQFQSSGILTLWNQLVPTAISVSQVLTNAENLCTIDLYKRIANAGEECFRYCTNVPQCSPQISPVGINACLGNSNNDCGVENRRVSGLAYNPRSGFYTLPISVNFQAWVCTVEVQTSLGCECV